MAKKNLTSLISGIMGEKTESTPLETHAPEITSEMQDNLEAKRRQNVGRPKKAAPAKPTNETRATFIVDADIVRKLKYISLAEGQLLKEVVNTALTSYIDEWESENGQIRLPGLKSTKAHANIRGAEYYRKILEDNEPD